MIPKYKLIYQDIKENIQSGKYPQNEFLPSENELTKTYHCSRNTLRNALSILATEGLSNRFMEKVYESFFPLKLNIRTLFIMALGNLTKHLKRMK